MMASNVHRSLKVENKITALALEAEAKALVAEELTTRRATMDRDDIILDNRCKST